MPTTKNSKVAARYDKLRSKLVAKAEEQTIMSVVDVLHELESIAKDDVSSYLDFQGIMRVNQSLIIGLLSR